MFMNMNTRNIEIQKDYFRFSRARVCKATEVTPGSFFPSKKTRKKHLLYKLKCCATIWTFSQKKLKFNHTLDLYKIQCTCNKSIRGHKQLSLLKLSTPKQYHILCKPFSKLNFHFIFLTSSFYFLKLVLELLRIIHFYYQILFNQLLSILRISLFRYVGYNVTNNIRSLEDFG